MEEVPYEVSWQYSVMQISDSQYRNKITFYLIGTGQKEILKKTFTDRRKIG
jgi:hypothetical protein